MNSATVGTNSPAISESTTPGQATEISDVTREAKHMTDDEILELGTRNRTRRHDISADSDSWNLAKTGSKSAEAMDPWGGPPAQGDVDALDPPRENPELEELRSNARAYEEAFATPTEAQAGKLRLAELEVIDGLFFSKRPEDHVELARIVEQMDPASFGLFAETIARIAGGRALSLTEISPMAPARPQNEPLQFGAASTTEDSRKQAASINGTQEQFLHEANGAAIKGVLDAIELQVGRVIPEGISQTARKRVVGEIYREVEAALEANNDVARQIRAAVRSGDLSATHRNAIVSLVIGRARQILPSVAKKVMDEWTSTMMATNQERRVRQRVAESRVDIGGTKGSSSEGRRPHSPRDIDYRRMSDGDILNL